MNPTAIFSKSGKGVQEASGRTSLLSRGDRAVLAAIDGRATLAEVAQKVGKQFDNDFRSLVSKLDKDGFVREVSPGAAGAGAKPGAAPAKPASKPTAPMDMASDLDFTATMALPKKSAATPPPQAVPVAPAPAPKQAVVPPPPPPPSAAQQAKQAQIAKEQQSAFARAREEAERKQQEERDRVKAEAEAKVRAETEAKLRAEAEERMKAEAEAKAKRAEAEAAAARSAAIRAAAEAKVRAEAEAKRAREEAERAKREAEEKAERARQEAERARREAEEKARREQEELTRKLEEERRAREEAERRAKEEAERARRELEEERRKMEEERKRLEEEQRREEEERAARRRREEEEEAQRAAQRKLREEEAARKPEEDEFSLEKLMAAQAAPPTPPPAPQAKPAATGDAFADSLLADLDTFTQRDDAERKAKEDSDRKAKEEAERRKREEAERQEREAAEREAMAAAERRRVEEEARAAREAEERRAREEMERAEKEAEERRRKMTAEAAPVAGGDDLGITDDDLAMDEVKREAALLEKKKDRKEEREKEREKERQLKREHDREAKSRKEKERQEKETKKSAAAYRPRRKSKWGRNVSITLFLLLAVGLGVAHVIPLATEEYERAATEALGRPVKIGAGHFSVIGGVQYRFEDVKIGNELAVPAVRAFPELASLLGDRKVFSRVELEGLTLPQAALGDVLFGRAKGDSLALSRVALRNLKLSGTLPLPPLDGDVALEGGGLRAASLHGPEGLVARLTAKGETIEFDVNTAQFTLPFAPGITLIQFAMKGEANRAGMKISQWDGLLFSGQVTGTASVRWGSIWDVEGVLTARGVNAAVFAPALVSNGRAEGTGRFSMSGVEPAKLAANARLEGNFTVFKGVLGSFDLSRALQTGGRQVGGQTQFAEMSGQGVYDRGAVSLRNVNLGAGALNAGASADIAEGGALSGRIVADVRTSTQNVRATLILGGTVQEPQVGN